MPMQEDQRRPRARANRPLHEVLDLLGRVVGVRNEQAW